MTVEAIAVSLVIGLEGQAFLIIERRDTILTDKQKVKELVEAQPPDATFDEIMRELAFERMVERGLEDARNGRVISNEEMGQRIGSWQQ